VMQCGLLSALFCIKNNLQKSLSNQLTSRYIGELTLELLP